MRWMGKNREKKKGIDPLHPGTARLGAMAGAILLYILLRPFFMHKWQGFVLGKKKKKRKDCHGNDIDEICIRNSKESKV